jgi:hypothetical protein
MASHAEAGPTLRQAAMVTVAGYLMGSGVPFASFSLLPKLFVAASAVQTRQNIVAHPGQLVAVIFALLFNFIGDVVAAWGLYLLLRPVSDAVSRLAAWLRVVFAAMGLAAVLNLVTAHRLATRAESLVVLGQSQLDAQLHVALGAFNSQFAFSLIVFGAYLLVLGGLMVRSRHVPKWLGVLILLDGAAWCVMEAGHYLLPGVDLGWLFIPTFAELILLVWLVGWGFRLREPAAVAPP